MDTLLLDCLQGHDTDIWKYIHGNFAQIWEDVNLRPCQHLPCSMKDRLLGRLPFSKNMRSFVRQDEWTRLLIPLIRRTWDSEGWFDQACQMDAERRTEIGTLNYLPQELRDQICDLVIRPKKVSNQSYDLAMAKCDYTRHTREYAIFMDRSDRQFKNIIREIDCLLDYVDALGTTGSHIFDAFFSKFTLHFKEPRHLLAFLRCFENGSQPKPRFSVHVIDDASLSAEVMDALLRLPFSTLSVTFEFRYMFRYDRPLPVYWTHCILEDFESMVKAVARRYSKAEVSVLTRGAFSNLSGWDREKVGAILQGFER